MRLLRFSASVSVLILLAGTLWAQIPRSQVVFAYLGLSVDSKLQSSLRDTDIQLLDNKLRGSLLEIARDENYSITTPKNSQEIVGYLTKGQQDKLTAALIGFGSSLTANGVLLCQLERQTAGTGLVFTATLYASPSAEVVVQQSDSAATIDELIEHSPLIVYQLFGLSPPSAQNQITQNNITTRNAGNFTRDRALEFRDISGSWQGDYGLQKVQINGDGTALAWLSDIDTMQLSVHINGQSIIITQNEANSPKLYLPVFPYTVASQIVRLARPMSWEFKLTIEQDRLIGKKETSYFFIEQGKIIQVDNTYSRDAVWTRMP